MNEKKDTFIPKNIHFIWLGSILSENYKESRPFPEEDQSFIYETDQGWKRIGCKNVENWKKENPNFQVSLWVDSRKYLDHNNEKEKLNKLINWAEKYNICLKDVSPIPIEEIRNYSKEIYEGMLNQEYYDDELSGKFCINYGSSSDILRVEILFKEGGFYFDTKDIFPGKKNLENVKAPHGFLFRLEKNSSSYSFCNDVMASVPGGELVKYYRELIHINYENLYKKKKFDILRERNIDFVDIGGLIVNAPKKSTIALSGPDCLRDLMRHTEEVFPPKPKDNFNQLYEIYGELIYEKIFQGEISVETYEYEPNERGLQSIDELSFPRESYAEISGQAHEWYHCETLNTKEFIFSAISMQIRNYFLKQLYSIDIDEEFKTILNKFIEILESSSGRISLQTLYNSFIQTITQEQILLINENYDEFLTKFKKSSDFLEFLIDNLNQLSPDEWLNFISEINWTDQNLGDTAEDFLKKLNYATPSRNEAYKYNPTFMHQLGNENQARINETGNQNNVNNQSFEKKNNSLN